jgi:hypothetical protein
MTFINSPLQQVRRDIRYPLNLPVRLKLANQITQARSKNISLRGILLSSALQIPEGSTVDVAVGVANLPDHSVQLSARGMVLRLQPGPAGNFIVAIEFEHPFELGLQTPDNGSQEKRLRSPEVKNRIVGDRGLHLASAWYTET